MGKFDLYKIDLRNLDPGVHHYEYKLDNTFFVNIDSDEVRKGRVNVALTLTRTSVAFEMDFQINGVVMVSCDRCLDDMDITVETRNRLVVKFGAEYAEESDEVVVIPESEGMINLAWFLYEFVALAVPMKRVHTLGKCNKSMTSKLKKHSNRSNSDESDDDDYSDDRKDSAMEDDTVNDTDPRWEALKNLMEEE